MSAIKITFTTENPNAGLAISRNVVKVDGKFAYQHGNANSVEAEHIEKLLDLMVIENVEVIVK